MQHIRDGNKDLKRRFVLKISCKIYTLKGLKEPGNWELFVIYSCIPGHVISQQDGSSVSEGLDETLSDFSKILRGKASKFHGKLIQIIF